MERANWYNYDKAFRNINKDDHPGMVEFLEGNIKDSKALKELWGEEKTVEGYSFPNLKKWVESGTLADAKSSSKKGKDKKGKK